MPFKARLAQAIQEEDAKAVQRKTFHIVGPGALVVFYIVAVGAFAVRVIGPTDIFGGRFDIFGYGLLGALISLALSKRYIADKWLDTWTLIEEVRRDNITRIEGVMARMEEEQQAPQAVPAAPANPDRPIQPDPWLRALAAAPAAQDAASPSQQQ